LDRHRNQNYHFCTATNLKQITMHSRHLALLVGLIFATITGTLLAQESEKPASPDIKAITADDPTVPLDELSLLVKPLTVDELKAEAEAWMSLLKEKTRETTQAELAIKQKNKSIEKAEEVQEAIEETQGVLEDVKQASSDAQQTGDLESMETAQELAEQARQTVNTTINSIETAVETRQEVAENSTVQNALSAADQARADSLTDQAQIAREATRDASISAGKAVLAAESGDNRNAARLSAETEKATQEAGDALQSTSEVIDQAITEKKDVVELAKQAELGETAQLAAALAEKEIEDKKNILMSVTELRTQRTAITDRMNVVLDELSAKLGTTPEGVENEFILPFRLYAQSVNSIKMDVTDTQSAMSNIVGWIRSDVGGVRLLRNLSYFVLSVAAFWVLGWILGKLVDRTLKITRITVELMRSVIVRMVRRVTLLVGIIVGLSAMGINIGPILAVIGAAGFVVAFALQNTLSNFASGIMIMIYRPFDVGDLISVGGVTGEARSMNLVSTTIATRDNQLLVVPNNTIWNNIIVNVTGSDTRRIDLMFRIGYNDDIELAQSLIQEVLDQHPMVLKQPEATIAVGELDTFSVNLICRPWAKTDDYWQVHREVTRSVKDGLQAAGLKPPFLEANLRPAEPGANAAIAPPAFPVS